MKLRSHSRHLRSAGSRGRAEPYSTLHDESLLDSGPPLTMAVGRAGPRVVVTIRGELDEPDVTGFEGILAELIADPNHLEVTCDLRGVTHAGSAAISVIAAAAKEATARDIAFKVSRPPAPLVADLTAAGLAASIDSGVDKGPTWVTSLRVS